MARRVNKKSWFCKFLNLWIFETQCYLTLSLVITDALLPSYLSISKLSSTSIEFRKFYYEMIDLPSIQRIISKLAFSLRINSLKVINHFKDMRSQIFQPIHVNGHLPEGCKTTHLYKRRMCLHTKVTLYDYKKTRKLLIRDFWPHITLHTSKIFGRISGK